MVRPKLCIVIHAEEEFDWDKGFYRANTDVTHGQELIELVDEIIELQGKVTLAMDYPFVSSSDGKKVIKHYHSIQGNQIEFGTHLHPWVNPPFTNNKKKESNYYSFPGNLKKEDEFNKLKQLTEKIEEETGTRPISYLAGRYGIGKNTCDILNSLGYKIDLSISAYTNFADKEGPNFIEYSNKISLQNGLLSIPHTCSMVCPIKAVENYFNRNSSYFEKYSSSQLKSILLKLLRVNKYRLSPEGFSFKHMRQVTNSQLNINQEYFILSFHSPSAKAGLSPYVKDKNDLTLFKENISKYINYFKNEVGGEFFLAHDLIKDY